jgi:hypothetical protein
MNDKEEIKDKNIIEEVKNFLINLGFVSNSDPSAQHLIFTKDGETVVIKNSQH